MDICDLIRIQREFDDKHGWVPNDNVNEIIRSVNRDLIGLVGEVGEFSNIIKKLNLINDYKDASAIKDAYDEQISCLQEELIDAYIYLFRIASYLKVDVENEYLKKLNSNRKKYKGFEDERA